MNHGTIGMYDAGCRCAACRMAEGDRRKVDDSPAVLRRMEAVAAEDYAPVYVAGKGYFRHKLPEVTG